MSKILPDYFKGDIYKPRQKNKLPDIAGWIFGIVFSIGALVSIRHPLLILLFGFLGFLLLPPGHRWLEKKLRFQFKTKPKAIVAAALLIAAFPLTGHYFEVDRAAAYQQNLVEEKERREKLIAEQKDKQRRDSLNFYLQQSVQLQTDHKLADASKELDYAFAFAATTDDKSLIERQRTTIASQKTLNLVNAGKYQVALPELNTLLSESAGNADLLYNRALCYSKTGKIAEAVADCKMAMQGGNAAAKKLHDKINPTRKRITGYITRCCDGSTSYARGRGACSHHGGVCDWNKPVYEEHRKYE